MRSGHRPANRPISRRQGLVGLAALLTTGWWARPAWSKESELPVPASLPEVAQAAAAQGEPLVLLISLPGCPYCELVRRNYLLPGRSAGWQAWQLNVRDSSAALIGFDGQPTNAQLQTRAWKARFTPTVLFFDYRGREVAERLVGASPDFYAAYLEERLGIARQAVRKVR